MTRLGPVPNAAASPSVHDPVEDAMARYLADPRLVAAVAAFDLRRYRDALTALVPTATDDVSRLALRRLRQTQRPLARAMSNRLPLFLANYGGCGFRLIGDTDPVALTHATVRWITFFFLPIWPLRGYLVRYLGAYEYEYLAEIPFDLRLRWTAVGIAAVAALLYGVSRLAGL